MQKLSNYKSVNENQFNALLEKYTINDSKFASMVGINQSSVSLKRHRGFRLSFAQAFTFYANYYLSDSELTFLLEKMRSDGFVINED